MNIEKYLTELKTELLQSTNWNKIVLTRQWTLRIPSAAGVYAIKEGKEIVYVGETGNLKGRMNDLLDSRHHCIRRTLGKNLYSKHKGFIQATTKIKFPKHIEILLDEHVRKNLRLAFLPVALGRKELEEFIEQDIRKEIKLNKRGKRKSQ